MGCVQSHQQDRGGRRQQDRRSQQQHRPQQQQQQQRHRQQQQQQNGQLRQVPRKSSNDRNVATNLYENVPPMGRIKNTDSVKNVDNDDSQFRRQHFDRNSCLRHSKKRKKSTASNQNSPAILNGSEISDVRQQNRKNR